MIRGTFYRIEVLLLAATLASCGGETPRRDGWRVAIDTLPSGAELVVNVPPERRDTSNFWLVEEELRIGGIGSSDPRTFAEVRGLAVDSVGRIYVLAGMAGEVRVFEPSGDYLGSIGGSVIESLQANGIALAPDGTIWVADSEAGRVFVFDSRGELKTTHRVPFPGDGGPWQGGFDGEGHLYDIALLPAGSPDRTATLRRFDEDLDVVQMYALPREQGELFHFPRGATRVPFTGELRWILDPRGYIWFTDTDRYRIYKRTFEGDTARVIGSWRDPIPVDPAERDSALDRLHRFSELVGEAYIDLDLIPETKPVLENIDLDSRGRLWVRVTDRRPNTIFEVFDSTGVFVATAAADFRVPEWWHPIIRDSAMYALTQDELGVPYVIRARIREH